MPTFTSPPPAIKEVLVSFPAAHVVLLTLNRPDQLNSLPTRLHGALDVLFRWYDAEPSLRCAVITGAGRAFCAGADLKEHDAKTSQDPPEAPAWVAAAGGFGGLSNRAGKKPVVAAVNGICVGGGMEMALNCDLVVAAAGARFGLPEVTRGVVALAGALPRAVRSLGRQRAAEMALTGRLFTAAELLAWGVVNRVVGNVHDDAATASAAAVAAAVELAAAVAANSPDAVIVTREGLRLGWEGVGPEAATDTLLRGLYGQMNGAANMKEGVRSFVERRAAVWTDSKL